jgi:hypothetical protein
LTFPAHKTRSFGVFGAFIVQFKNAFFSII